MQQSLLSEHQRGEILDAISRTVTKRFYDPQLPHDSWEGALDKHRSKILTAPNDEAFEAGIADLLAELKRSHVGMYHTGLLRCTSKMAICALYSALPVEDGSRWVFQDVHEGGPAAEAGIRPGDALIAVDGRPFRPPEHPFFSMDSTATIEVATRGGQHVTRQVVIPFVKVKRNQLPKVEPKPIVSQRRINEGIGYIKIASYPGEIGVDIANEITEALQSLGEIDSLVIDLRGNTGGGIGVLRMMSFLTPDRLAVGVFSNGTLKNDPDVPEGSFVFDKIPATKGGLLPLAVRFFASLATRKLTGKKMPIAVVTEGKGRQPFHGKAVLLVDRHTTSANEMLIAFAREHKLATIVGEPTPGRVLGGSKFKLPHGYWLALPVGSFRTTDGDPLEGNPIVPDVEVPFDVQEAREGRDTQLETALRVASKF